MDSSGSRAWKAAVRGVGVGIVPGDIVAVIHL